MSLMKPYAAMSSDTMTAVPAMLIPGSFNFGLFSATDFQHWSNHSPGFKTTESQDHGTQT